MLNKWISYYENIIHKEDCDVIISYPWDWKPSSYSNNKGKVEKSNERVRMDECWCVDINKPYPLLKKSVIEVMNLYAQEQKYFSCIRHTDFRLNRYGIDGFMSKHCDNIHHSHGQQYGYPQATVLFFLNDDYDGGDFYVAENLYRPKAGSAIIFPSNFMFPHEVKKVTNGERWSIVSWLM